MTTSRFPRLTMAVLEAADRGRPPFTAQGITAQVQKILPFANQQTVTAELARLIEEGKIQKLHQPHPSARLRSSEPSGRALPARFRLTPPKPAPRPNDEQLSLLP